MGLMSEYINCGMSAKDFEEELLKLIQAYNSYRKTHLLVMASAINKQIPDVALSQEDFYMVADLLDNVGDIQKVDIYLETPGGSGEAAEEIVEFLRTKFDYVSFVVSGEAKSAGTIMVLSGDEILMTNTGSLGPIDAQVRIGRSTISASDYMDWVVDKQQQAQSQGRLNPFDATMVAQISPGELTGVNHALRFAEDLVGKWLKKYKFKHWSQTGTRHIPVTEKMKEDRAREIAGALTKHSTWRSHGRSIKVRDLEEIGLRITQVENDQKLKDIVCRIQVVCRLLFGSTNYYKIFATQNEKIFKSAVPMQEAMRIPKNRHRPDAVQIDHVCPQCGKKSKFYAKLVDKPSIDKDFQQKGHIPFPKDNKVKCECGFETDMGGIKNDIESKTGMKVLD